MERDERRLFSPTPQPPRDLPDVKIMALASRWRSEEQWMSAVEFLDDEPEPEHLGPNRSGPFIVISPDKLSVEYTEEDQHGHDVGAVQADCPAPTLRLAYYFEMTVNNAGEKGQISIGFTRRDFDMHRHPGWEPGSCGYHGDDGHIYLDGNKSPFGPTFTTNDVVGAGINNASKEFFFIKNGNVVGAVKNYLRGRFFPTVAVHSQNEKVTVNFGKKPFVFDLEGFILAESKLPPACDQVELQPNISHWIVRSYLSHYGHQDSLKSFDILNETTHQLGSSAHNDSDSWYALERRSILCQLIKNGNVDSAIQRLREWYPQVLKDETSHVCLLLHSQRFIEYIRVKDLDRAIAYGRTHLAKFFSIEEFVNMAEETASLVAYEEPLQSPVGYLLGLPQREFVADAVNAVVLSTNPFLTGPESCISSALERLLRQLTECSQEVASKNRQLCHQFYLHKEIR